MKKTRKVLAVVLSVMMLIGLVSFAVSADGTLTVTEELLRGVDYSEDFSGAAYNSNIVAATGVAVADGALGNDGAVGDFASIYVAKEGTLDTTIFDFDLIPTKFTWTNTQIGMDLISAAGGQRFSHFVLYGGGTLKFGYYAGGWNYSDQLSDSPYHVTIKAVPKTGSVEVKINDVVCIAEEGSNAKLRWADAFKDISSLKLSIAGAACESLSIDNVKVYTIPDLDETPVPAIGEILSHEDFEDSTYVGNLVTSAGTNTLSTGYMACSAAGDNSTNMNYYINADQSTPTGEYVAEVTVSDATTSSSADSAFRLWFLDGNAAYVYWKPSAGTLGFRNYSYSTAASDNFTKNIDDYNARNVLKITAHVNTYNNIVKVWFNDKYAGSYSVPAIYAAKYMSFRIYNGTTNVDDILIYRPVQDKGEILSHEDFNDTTYDSRLKLNPASNANVTNTQSNGSLTCASTASSGTTNNWEYYFNESQTGSLSGVYFVETTLSNATGLITFWFNAASSQGRIQWNPTTGNNTLSILSTTPTKTCGGSADALNSYDGATKKLKITARIDPSTNEAKIWFNDIYAETVTITGMSASPHITIRVNPGCSVKVDDIIVYRPMTSDVMMVNDGNDIAVSSANGAAGNVYFAKYENDDPTQGVQYAGVSSAFTTKRDYVYKIDKSMWSGGKAFFWDENFNPLADAVAIN